MNDDEFLNDRDCTPKGETPRTESALCQLRYYETRNGDRYEEQLTYIEPDFARELERELIEVRADLEREIMRLAACGVVALANTPDSAKRAREMRDEYRSDSLLSVQSAVDKEMHYRGELARALRVVEAARQWHRYDAEASLEHVVEEWEAGR
jgi:hypothetical protein